MEAKNNEFEKGKITNCPYGYRFGSDFDYTPNFECKKCDKRFECAIELKKKQKALGNKADIIIDQIKEVVNTHGTQGNWYGKSLEIIRRSIMLVAIRLQQGPISECNGYIHVEETLDTLKEHFKKMENSKGKIKGFEKDCLKGIYVG